MISVIVPVYNAGPYLQELIQSILNQTNPDLELLLVDDGSTDGSGEFCDLMAEKDSRIRVFHKENGGQSSARNFGLEQARGDLIAFADHDDVLHPRMYETLMRGLNQTGAFVCACGFQNTDDGDIPKIDYAKPILPVEAIPRETIISRFFTPDWHIPVWNKLYRREAIKELRFHDAMLGEDNLFSYRILKQCNMVAFCPTVLYFQRMHGDNFEFTGISHLVELLQAKQTVLEDMKTSFPAEYRSGQKRFIYECVRIYNLYAAQENDEYATQRNASVNILKNQLRDVVKAEIPLAHKIKLELFVLTRKYRSKKQIVL